jgi:hypothetical protein
MVEDWMDAMRGHICENKELIPSDSPKERKLGFLCTGCNDCFLIKKDAVEKQDPDLYRNIVNVDARKKLGKILSNERPGGSSDDKVTMERPGGSPDDKVTVIVLKGDKVMYNRTHSDVEISQTRKVTPEYRWDYQNCGQTTGLHVEPGS